MRRRSARIYGRRLDLPPLATQGRLRGSPIDGAFDVVARLGMRSIGGSLPGRRHSFAFGIHGEILNGGSRTIYAF
jgi:hypothetical protein